MSATFERSTITTNGSSCDHSTDGELPLPLPLELIIHDPEVVRALLEYSEGDARNEYAIKAMKIGVLAIRHVGGQVSADMIRHEGDRLIGGLHQTFDLHKNTLQNQMELKLKEYFDPKDGRFADRVQRLVAQDGELSQLLKSFIDGENSLFARTLIKHVGQNSLLMRMLDPQQSDGLITALRKIVEEQLRSQRDRILSEFSLDNKEGALGRLVNELTTNYGVLGKDIQQGIDKLMKEFSLNEKDSALSRLVQNVADAQSTITNEFSLDSDTSCLSRLKKELMTVLEAQVKTNADFQDEVKASLRELSIRRDEQSRSTAHGATFQRVLFEYLQTRSAACGDVAEFVGDMVGAVSNCKKGDVLIQMGQDTISAGARIIFEAKDEEKYPLTKALDEIELARKNRQAQVGVFVYSSKTAPSKLPPLSRFGSDIVVVWNSEDPLTDSYLWGALEFARVTCLGSQVHDGLQADDFEGIQKLLANIENRAKNLQKVRTYALTANTSAKKIQTATGKIVKRVDLDHKALDRHVATLRKRIQEIRDVATKSS